MEFDKAKAVLADARLKAILGQLEEPFDPDLIYWKPQATNSAKDKAVAAAYADPRAYSDRLNEVVGPDKWSTQYTVHTIGPIIHPKTDPKAWKTDFAYKGKVLVVATLTIEGVGSNSGTGESDAVDENAITSAEAQAFKRAATRFGLGRYLYDLPKNQWCPYDKDSRRITEPPELPDWAVPKKHCDDCTNVIEPFPHKDSVISVSDLIINSQRKYKKVLCAPCQKIRSDATKKPAVATELARAV